MSRPVILDLFCKAGGAGKGYHLAGFDVVGVDFEAQPRYPFDFVRADAFSYLAAHAGRYDAFHASPPCQAYTRAASIHDSASRHPDLIAAVRDSLAATGRPWVIENVQSNRTPMSMAFLLCGAMFGLKVWRHRLFECSHWIGLPPHPKHDPARLGRTARRGEYDRGQGGMITVAGHNFNRAAAADAMGVDWMSREELCQAIPPAYTLHIGRQLIRVMRGADDGEEA